MVIPRLDYDSRAKALFSFIRTPARAFSGKSVSLLADVRAYPLLRDSLGDHSKKRPTNFDEFRKWVDSYLTDLEVGVSKRAEKKIEEAKRFCLSLNTHMLARQMNELYTRRERSESRPVREFINHTKGGMGRRAADAKTGCRWRQGDSDGARI
jgi:hypothetical protein